MAARRISAGSESGLCTSGSGSSEASRAGRGRLARGRRQRWWSSSGPRVGWALGAASGSLRGVGRCSRSRAPARRRTAAVRRMPGTGDQPSGFVSPWIRPSVTPSRCAAAAPAAGDDLGRDADRGLLRRPGAEVEPDRAGQPVELLVGQPGLAEPLQPVVVGTPRAHRADVGHLGHPQRDLEQRYVELRVVGQHGDHGARVDPAGLVLGGRGSGAASRRPPRRPRGTGWWSRTPAGRRRRSRGSRGTRPPAPPRPRSRSRRTPAAAAWARTPTRRPASPRPGARRPARRSASRCARPPAAPSRRPGPRRRPWPSRGSG